MIKLNWPNFRAWWDRVFRYPTILIGFVLTICVREWFTPMFGILISMLLSYEDGRESRERGWATVVCSVPGFVFRFGGFLISKEVGGSFMVGVYGLAASLCLLAVFRVARRGLEIGHLTILAMVLFYRFV